MNGPVCDEIRVCGAKDGNMCGKDRRKLIEAQQTTLKLSGVCLFKTGPVNVVSAHWKQLEWRLRRSSQCLWCS